MSISRQKGSIQLIPKDGATYGLRESFVYMKENYISANKIYSDATDVVLNPKPPKLVCSCRSFF